MRLSTIFAERLSHPSYPKHLHSIYDTNWKEKEREKEREKKEKERMPREVNFY